MELINEVKVQLLIDSLKDQELYIHLEMMTGAGGLYSTVEDLYLWDNAFYSDVLLSEKSRNLL